MSGSEDKRRVATDKLERWLTDHRAAMLEVARRYEGSAIRAEDIVQEAAVKAISLTDRAPAVEHPRRWLRTITRHAGLRAVTKSKRRRELWVKGLVDPTIELEQELRSVDDWEREVILSDRLGIVLDAVRQLHPAQREVIWSRLDGKRDDEIAKALGISKTTVRVRWHRAVKMLRDKILGARWLVGRGISGPPESWLYKQQGRRDRGFVVHRYGVRGGGSRCVGSGGREWA